MTLIEVVDKTAEISLPWTIAGETPVAQQLVLAALHIIRTDFPRIRYIRSERALLPGDANLVGLEAAGFHCHWRLRMHRTLSGWWDTVRLPVGYKLVPWNIRYLDEAAQVVFHANAGTLDAELYGTVFRHLGTAMPPWFTHHPRRQLRAVAAAGHLGPAARSSPGGHQSGGQKRCRAGQHPGNLRPPVQSREKAWAAH